MTVLNQFRVTWTGAPVVGGGISTFYSVGTDVSPTCDALRNFFASLATIIPTGVQLLVPAAGDTVESSTNQVAGTWADPTPTTPVVASGNAQFVNGTGARIRWLTAGVRNGRKVVGSTFVVPITSIAYEGPGNLTAPNITLLQTAANALIAAAPELRILSRPTAPGNGDDHVITGAVAPDLVSWLRSRRT